METSREVTVRLNLKPVQAEVLQRVFGDLAANTGKAQGYIDQITKGLEQQAQQATKLQVAMSPDLLKERVRLTIEEQKARKEMDAAFRREYERQTLTPAGRMLTRGADVFSGGAASKVVRGAIEGYRQKSTEAGGGVGGALAGIGGAVTGIVGGFAAAGSALKSFVAAANPAAVLRFDRALADVSGVIGRALAPVLDVVTGALRLFGDFLASVLPSGDQLREALAPIGELFDTLREALAPVAEILKNVFLVALKLLAVPLKIFGALIKGIVHYLQDIGILNKEDKLQSSVGASVRNATFTSSEAGAKSIYTAILASSAPKDGKKSTPAWLEKIYEVLNNIGLYIQMIIAAITHDEKELDRLATQSHYKSDPEQVKRDLSAEQRNANARANLQYAKDNPNSDYTKQYVKEHPNSDFAKQYLKDHPPAAAAQPPRLALPNGNAPANVLPPNQQQANPQPLNPPQGNAPAPQPRGAWGSPWRLPLPQGNAPAPIPPAAAAQPPRLALPNGNAPANVLPPNQQQANPLPLPGQPLTEPDRARPAGARTLVPRLNASTLRIAQKRYHLPNELIEQLRNRKNFDYGALQKFFENYAQQHPVAGHAQQVRQQQAQPAAAVAPPAARGDLRDLAAAFEQALRRVHQDPADRGRHGAREERGP
jgi:hypothetical protein